MAYQPVTSLELVKNRGPRPAVMAFRDTVIFFAHAFGITDAGIYNRRPVRGLFGILTPANASLHAVGRAWDAGVPHAYTNPGVGDHLAQGFVDHARECGIIEVIWNRRRWTAERGWQRYGGSNPHLDHVHVGFSIEMANNTSDHAALVRWFAHFLFGIEVP
jgi:hypothetical protein